MNPLRLPGLPGILVLVFFSFFLNGSRNFAQVPTGRTQPEDTSVTVIIDKVTILGNKITRSSIITRELKFRERDTLTIPRLSEAVRISRQNVFNTRLFNVVTIDTSLIPGTQLVSVKITVIERWYIWPIPVLEISDRNFNVWWETRQLDRLTYGVDFTFSNVRGRNETLKILTHFGYNQMYGFNYKIPYLNRRQTLGIGFGLDIELNHEQPVITMNNKPVYVRNNSTYLKQLVYGFAELIVRPDFNNTHTFRVSYSNFEFPGYITDVTGFVISDYSTQEFVSLNYLYKDDHRDVQYYPLTGYYLDVALNHAFPYETARNTFFKTNLRKYVQVYKRLYWASGFTGKMSIAKEQPYYLQRALGYGRDLVRGYEYYIIDGQHFALIKNNIKFAIVPERVEKLGFIRTTKFNTMPLALYINGFADFGYVYNYKAGGPDEQETGNTLENRILIGYGLGLDLTTYYDIVIRVEGTINGFGEPGLYLHFTAPI